MEGQTDTSRTLFTLLIFYGLVTLIWATPGIERIVHEKRIPNSYWKRQQELQSIVGPDYTISLKFGLQQSNLDTLDIELAKVSSPDSSFYGNYWSAERISKHFTPSEESEKVVSEWVRSQLSGLGSHHHPRISTGGAWLNIQLSLQQVEKLLDTKYYTYSHEKTGQRHIACEDYKLPRHLFPHIDVVLPTVHFDTTPSANKYQYANTKRKIPARLSSREKVGASIGHGINAPHVLPVAGAARRLGNPSGGNIPHYSKDLNSAQIFKAKSNLSHCANATTIDCLKALYKFGDYKMQSPNKHSLAIVEYTPQSVIYKDMDIFFSIFAPHVQSSRPRLVSIDGGEINQNAIEFGLNGESNLDLQYSMPLVYPLNVSLYQVGDPQIGGSFNNFLDALDAAYCSTPLDPMQDGLYPNPRGYPKRDCGTVKPADVISTSYGMNEADATPAYLIRQCNEYGKLGLMGTTFLFSSGDNGVAGNRGVCLSRDGSQSIDGKIFNPSFPGTCPYVTSVGATQVAAGKTVYDPEVACFTKIHSGGGFSNLFKMPTYQASAVKNFFKNHHPAISPDLYNSSMRTRGFPDLSANGANFVVAVEGQFGLVYGTSASAPVVASMLAMINDARISIGKTAVGFINPAIYSSRFRRAFNDIRNGTNSGCGTPGFSAVAGWDPVTGLGTIDFSKLLSIWTNL